MRHSSGIIGHMKELVFSTGNTSKYSYALDVCGQYGIGLTQSSQEIDEIQGEDEAKIALDKAAKAYDLLQRPVIVTDDSWAIPGLGGFPGAYMKSMNHWFRPEDFINLTQPLTDRRIFLTVCLAYQDAARSKLFIQKQEGVLLAEPKGLHGPAGAKIISMRGDDGLSIAEVHDKELNTADREYAKIWHEFAQWFNQDV